MTTFDTQQHPTSLPRDEFTISVTRSEGNAVVRVVGELDLATEPLLAAALHDLEGPCQRVILDLSRLTFMDSTGVRLALAEHERSKADGFELVVAGATGGVLKVLRLTGLDVTLPMAPDVASVLGDGTATGEPSRP